MKEFKISSEEEFLNKAEKGDVFSQIYLGMKHYAGIGNYTFARYSDAHQWFERAADLGSEEAMYYSGLLKINPSDIAIGYIRAEQYLLESANLNFYPAQYQLARMYYSGDGVKYDRKQGRKWFSKAVQQKTIDGVDNIEDLINKKMSISIDGEYVRKYFEECLTSTFNVIDEEAREYMINNDMPDNIVEAYKIVSFSLAINPEAETLLSDIRKLFRTEEDLSQARKESEKYNVPFSFARLQEFEYRRGEILARFPPGMLSGPISSVFTVGSPFKMIHS